MAFVYFLFFPALFHLTLSLPWTMDLPEVRQYYFQKYGNKRNEIDFKNNNTKTENENNTEVFNNYYSDSQYHEHNKGYMPYDMDYDLPDPEGHDGEKVILEEDLEKYTEDYEYQSYMEKKVTNIVHSGSKYLEGLRQSLEKYYSTLENCTRRNFTADKFQDQNPDTQSRDSSTFNASSISFEQCRNATRKSEKIRRIAQLALHTTRLLQDRVYSNKFDEQEEFDLEDRSLILRLSWFLDKLALLTGYVPEEKQDLTTTTRAPLNASPLPQPALVFVPDDIKRAMLECLHKTGNSTEPATVRCSFPITYNDFLRSLFDGGPSGTGPNNERPVPADLLRSLFNNGGELTSIPTDNVAISPQTDSQTDSKSVLPPKRVQKRSIPVESPLTNILEYYAKYKAWQNANTILKSQKETKIEFPEEIETKNSVLDKLQRDETLKTIKFPAKYLTKPETALTNDDQPEIQSDIRKKRSTYYEVNRKLPRIPEDPMQDISYYAKNKKGVNIQPNLVEAAQVRAGLEQIFQTGNIEVVRRYGSNYNPLDVAIVYQGILRSLPDAFT